ncbi:hypothetical protein [Sphingomonas profundi]|uniref:hypothetical protein n=1 Tax=Alterirhizorhabdus profundi TaxID=2681549 RepID=UPI0012E8AE3B|nr:hypothetical protein [Sphingomonas profundi]
MTDRTLEKIAIVAAEGGRGHQIVLCWISGDGGRVAEKLPETFDSEEAARARATADYGMGPEAGASPIGRRP